MPWERRKRSGVAKCAGYSNTEVTLPIAHNQEHADVRDEPQITGTKDCEAAAGRLDDASQSEGFWEEEEDTGSKQAEIKAKVISSPLEKDASPRKVNCETPSTPAESEEQWAESNEPSAIMGTRDQSFVAAAEPDPEELMQELELVQAVWQNEVTLCNDSMTAPDAHSSLVAQLTPLTAGEKQGQFVQCELLIEILQGYPSVPLRVSLKSSRGLSDACCSALLTTLRAKADELSGDPALYGFLEAAHEVVTSLNTPQGECAICLLDLVQDGGADVSESCSLIVRTPCFHTFHTKCLATYWHSVWLSQLGAGKRDVSLTKVSCPECCRELLWSELVQIHSDVNKLVTDTWSDVKSSLDASHGVCNDAEKSSLASCEDAECPLAETKNMCNFTDDGNSGSGSKSAGEKQEVTLFEVVHHCGTCFRTSPKWNSRVDNGHVNKGATGVVAEMVESDTTYIRPEGSKFWLPIKGRTASQKIIHLESACNVKDHTSRIRTVTGQAEKSSSGPSPTHTKKKDKKAGAHETKEEVTTDPGSCTSKRDRKAITKKDFANSKHVNSLRMSDSDQRWMGG